MGRSQSNQAFQQSEGQSAQDQGNAQSALSGTNQALQGYDSNLANFMKFGRATYGQNGEFAQDQNVIANTTAAAGNKANQTNMALNAMRTGANTANYAPAAATAQRQSEQDVTSQLANADATRLQNLTNINQYGVQASALPAQIQSSLYGSSLSGANGAGSNAVNAAKTPGFLDTFLPSLVGAAGQVGAGYAQGLAKNCWIAAELYGGWSDPRTIAVRKWLNTEFVKRPVGKMVMALYLRYGKRVAAFLHKRPQFKVFFRPLFDLALKRASK